VAGGSEVAIKQLLEIERLNKMHNEPKTVPLESGQKYELFHERFGKARVRILKLDDTWAECQILRGTLRGLGQGAVWGPGQIKSVRLTHGNWTQLI